MAVIAETAWPDYMPPRNPWAEPFWQGLSEARLMLPRCEACHRVEYPPLNEHCADCDGAWRWVTAGGQARLWSWATFHRVYYPEYPLTPPYTVLMVELDESGVRMLATLPPDVAPDALQCDMRLEFAPVEVEQTVWVPGFRPMPV